MSAPSASWCRNRRQRHDLSGKDYKHGELVAVGERACGAIRCCRASTRSTPTPQGDHGADDQLHLKWNRSETGSHKFDENLAEVNLITKDAFEPSLPLSVWCTSTTASAAVIQRFGDVKKLVEQTLDPMVSAYFKNIARPAP